MDIHQRLSNIFVQLQTYIIEDKIPEAFILFERIIKVEITKGNEELQAKIDSLMLEYCPDEMTKEQMDNWAKHQKPVDIIDNNDGQCDTCKYGDLEARDEPCTSCVYGNDGDVCFTNEYTPKDNGLYIGLKK